MERTELTEEEIRQLAETIRRDKTSSIKTINQKENKNFKKLKEMPLIKQGGKLKLGPMELDIGQGKKTFAVKEDKTEEYKQEIKKLLQKITEEEQKKREAKEAEKQALRERNENFLQKLTHKNENDIKKTEKRYEKAENEIQKTKKEIALLEDKISKGNATNYRPIKSPYVRMLRADGTVEWFEGVKAGVLEITRSDEKPAYIGLRKDKLQSETIQNIDGTHVTGWDVYENDHSPLPSNPAMDSHGWLQDLKEIMTNNKDLQTQRINALGNLVWPITIGIVVILAVLFIAMPMFMGKNIIEVLNEADLKKANIQGTTTTVTPEELAILNQIRIQRAMNATDKNSGG